MNAEQQKGNNHPGDGGEGRTPTSTPGSQQTFAAWVSQRALTASLMEQVCDPKNLIRAYRRVRANKGTPGVDGMTVHELMDWLRNNQAALTASLLDGTYQPFPVRGAQIRKPGGGQRQLGIPVVVDCLVQQAILQVLEPIFDPTFFNSSYGFRPGRSPHMALEQARQYVNSEGREIVVDLDLEKLFDRVNHDILMSLGSCGKGWWRLANSSPVKRALSNDWFSSQGLVSLALKYAELRAEETAVYV